MNTKILDVPQNWIIRRIRDVVRRKITATGRKVHCDVKYASTNKFGYTQAFTERAELIFGSLGQTIAVITLDKGTLVYAFGGRVKKFALPPIESPKFDPDAIAKCILTMYNEWDDLRMHSNLSHQVVIDMFEAMDGVSVIDESCRGLPSSLSTLIR